MNNVVCVERQRPSAVTVAQCNQADLSRSLPRRRSSTVLIQSASNLPLPSVSLCLDSYLSLRLSVCLSVCCPVTRLLATCGHTAVEMQRPTVQLLAAAAAAAAAGDV